MLLEIKNYTCIGEVITEHKLLLVLANINMNIKVKLSHSALKLNKKFKLFGLKYNCKEFVGNSSNCNNKFTVHIDHCQFNYNHIYSLISSVLPTKEYIKSKSIVIFSNCIFLTTTCSLIITSSKTLMN